MERASLLLNLIRSRRSIRRFRSDSIPREYLDMILEAARWVPSAGYRQPWRFIIVSDMNTLEKIGEIYQDMRVADIKGVSSTSNYYKAIAKELEPTSTGTSLRQRLFVSLSVPTLNNLSVRELGRWIAQ